MTQLMAVTVQKKLWRVKDRQIVAYGYAPLMEGTERLSYAIWFEAGSIHRAGYTFDGKVKEYLVHKFFQPDFFTANIKRWYNSTIPAIVIDYFDTFGMPLSVTSGGRMPKEPPDVADVVPDSIDGVLLSK